ncbi:fimbrial protein [Escherichia coli O8:H49]
MKIIKKSIYLLIMIASVIFSAHAIDIPVRITGAVYIPPCTVNNGNTIIVSFDKISVADVDNIINKKTTDIVIDCPYAQGTAYVKVTGAKLNGHENILSVPGVEGFGISLYQGNDISTPLLIGNGSSNGSEYIGYKITKGLSGSNLFTFTALPYSDVSPDKLKTGAFKSTASMSINYF